MVRMEANECRTKWAHPSPDILHLSESMQSLKIPEDNCEELKSALSSIREEVKSFGEKVKALEDQISKDQISKDQISKDQHPEEQRQREQTAEDP